MHIFTSLFDLMDFGFTYIYITLFQTKDLFYLKLHFKQSFPDLYFTYLTYT